MQKLEANMADSMLCSSPPCMKVLVQRSLPCSIPCVAALRLKVWVQPSCLVHTPEHELHGHQKGTVRARIEGQHNPTSGTSSFTYIDGMQEQAIRHFHPFLSQYFIVQQQHQAYPHVQRALGTCCHTLRVKASPLATHRARKGGKYLCSFVNSALDKSLAA